MRHLCPCCHPAETLSEQPPGSRPTGPRPGTACRPVLQGVAAQSAVAGIVDLGGSVLPPCIQRVCCRTLRVTGGAVPRHASRRRAPASGVVLGRGWVLAGLVWHDDRLPFPG